MSFLIVVLSALYVVIPATWPDLAISDGSTIGLVELDFTKTNYSERFAKWFNATTYASQPGNKESGSLTLRLATFSDNMSRFGGPAVAHTGIVVNVSGSLDSRLNANQLRLDVGQVATNTDVNIYSGAVRNVSVDTYDRTGFWDSGSCSIVYRLINRTHEISPYEFTFWISVMADQHNISDPKPRVLSILATLTGEFHPAVSVGVTLIIVNSGAN